MITRHLRSNAVAYLALLIACSTSTAYAADQIANGAVTTAKLAKDSVTTSKIRANAVRGSEVQDGSLTGADLAAGSVASRELVDGSVSGLDLADGSVGSGELVNGSVSGLDLAAGSVGSSTISDGTITTVDLESGVVPQDALVFIKNDVTANTPAAPGDTGMATMAIPAGTRGGTALIEFIANHVGLECSAGSANMGMYVDGVPVPGTRRSIPSSTNVQVGILMGTAVLTPGAHTIAVRGDCPSGNPGTVAIPQVSFAVTLLAE